MANRSQNKTDFWFIAALCAMSLLIVAFCGCKTAAKPEISAAPAVSAPDPTPTPYIRVNIPKRLQARLLDEGDRATIVREGDTLYDIAGAIYGDPHLWPILWWFNTNRITNPDDIQEGMRIVYPKQLSLFEIEVAHDYADREPLYKGTPDHPRSFNVGF